MHKILNIKKHILQYDQQFITYLIRENKNQIKTVIETSSVLKIDIYNIDNINHDYTDVQVK